jgi:hypothetical protein
LVAPFEDPILLPDGRQLLTLEGRGRLHYEAAQEGVRITRVVDSDEALTKTELDRALQLTAQKDTEQ